MLSFISGFNAGVVRQKLKEYIKIAQLGCGGTAFLLFKDYDGYESNASSLFRRP